ncbi:peptidoglycan-binding protein [Streptomyces sp. GC420]|uniref:peptidoglycan-binding domain-containing protein n=1 Tax=Streptomyces sp. GC420 TaxID=2697568 RepID=UPI00141505C6|nr:peptidoglycan-binding domain-containing protein [Streptomyces sp. GC420]NBM20529.1 hypothetical protein [Streptomyces sp. GC420]
MAPTRTTRRRAGLLIASLALLGGTTGGGVAVATDRGADGAVSAAAYSCDVHRAANGKLYAGYYDGETVVPSGTRVTSSGIEAQCLLLEYNIDPGPVDGIFGPRSQAAAKEFQRRVNDVCGTNLAVDGKVGPRTWPYLRNSHC